MFLAKIAKNIQFGAFSNFIFEKKQPVEISLILLKNFIFGYKPVWLNF